MKRKKLYTTQFVGISSKFLYILVYHDGSENKSSINQNRPVRLRRTLARFQSGGRLSLRIDGSNPIRDIRKQINIDKRCRDRGFPINNASWTANLGGNWAQTSRRGEETDRVTGKDK